MIKKRNSWMSIAFLFAALLFIYAGHANGAAILSDDFNSSTVEPNPIWQFYDPYDTTAAIDPGESALTLNGTNALIDIPAGLTHDLWSSPYNTAPRLLQPADNIDFGIQVKFDSTVSKQYQLQGIIVQQTNDIFLRFDIVHDGTSPQVFAAYLNGADSTVYKSEAIPSAPAYVRVIRTGNQWTYQYSNDGSTWVDAVTFVQPITVTEVGFFAGAHTPSPAFLASVDYFMSLDSTILAGVDNFINLNPTITDNYVSNQGFESGISPWLFYSNTSGAFDNAAAGSGSPYAGHVTIGQAGSNVQLYQPGIVIEANTQYRLTFMAYSNTGHVVSVSLQKHGSPYTNYGLSNTLYNLTNSWAGYSVQFNTSGFSGTVNDGRLMFWLAPYATAGDQYFFDDVVLEKVVLVDTPVITTQPANQSVIVGQTATFSVTATSSLPLSYQWKRGGTDIAGATSASYTTLPTILADSGSVFTCTVSNTAGSISSSAATLTVTTTTTSLLSNPGFEFGAAPWVFYTNTSGSFNNNAAGNGSAHSGHISIAQAGSNVQLYQSDIVLEANAQYRLTFMAYSNTGHDVSVSLQKHGSPYTNYGLSNTLYNLTNSWAGYSVQFNTSGFSGTVNDGRLMFWLAPYAAAADEYFLDDVTLEMIIPTGPPVITAQPSNRTVVVGQSASFSVTATGTQPMSYQWQRNGTNIAGATSASYTTPATVLADSGAVFTCKISNSAGNVTSNAATLTVSATSNQNITLFDIVYTHSTTVVPIPGGESGKAFSFFDFPAGMPTNFVSPINYSLGRVYERLEVLTKPTNIGVHYQMCMFQDETISSKHVCGPEFAFATTGVYEINDPLSNWFQYYNIDWNRSLLLEMLVVKDAAGAPVDDRWGFGGYWIGSPDLSLYYPMQVRFRAVLVPPGGTFPGW
jgi:hypothetical protein